MTITSVWYLKENSDGSQHTNYPDGDKPATAIDPPENLQVSGFTSSTLSVVWSYGTDPDMTGFYARVDIGSGYGEYIPVSGGSSARSYTATGLPPETSVGIRIYATDEVSF